MNHHCINLYKPQGATPLEMIKKLRSARPALSHETLGYAGRLDPMAEGVLLVLVGEENNRRKKYEKLPKTYRFDILIGIESDTYDPLGLVQNPTTLPPLWKSQLKELLKQQAKQFSQPYPPYSSPRVKGKPLFYWARKGLIDTIEIPTKAVEIYELELENMYSESIESVVRSISRRVNEVSGDFRQEEIMAKWQEIQRKFHQKTLGVATVQISCSSGLYIRSLCHSIGQKLGTGALAYSITRTRIADFTIENAVRL